MIVEKELSPDDADAILHITYYAAIIDGLVNNFDKEIGDWCNKNGIDTKAIPILLRQAKEELVGLDT